MWQKSVTCSSVVGKMFCIQVMYDSTCNAKRVLTIVILKFCLSVSVAIRYRTRPRHDKDSVFSPYDSVGSSILATKLRAAG